MTWEPMDFGTREWNEYYHGRNNRIVRVSDAGKRTRKAMRRIIDTRIGEVEAYEAMRECEEAEQAESDAQFQAFEDSCGIGRWMLRNVETNNPEILKAVKILAMAGILEKLT